MDHSDILGVLSSSDDESAKPAAAPNPQNAVKPHTLTEKQREFLKKKIEMKRKADATKDDKKTKLIPVQRMDPEKERRERIRRETERLKAKSRSDNYRRRPRQRESYGERRMSANFLEDHDSEDEGVSVRSIKQRYTDAARHSRAPSSEAGSVSDMEQFLNFAKLDSSDESDVEPHDNGKPPAKKRIIEEDD